MQEPDPVEPLLVVHVAGARLGLPISCLDRLASDTTPPQLDLAELCELDLQARSRSAQIAIHSGAGTVAVAIDGVGEVLRHYTLEQLSPLSRLTKPHMVQGLAREGPEKQSWVVILDGVAIGDLIASRIFETQS